MKVFPKKSYTNSTCKAFAYFSTFEVFFSSRALNKANVSFLASAYLDSLAVVLQKSINPSGPSMTLRQKSENISIYWILLKITNVNGWLN